MIFPLLAWLITSEPPPIRRLDSSVELTLNWHQLEDARLVRRLIGGLTTTLTLEAELRREGDRSQQKVVVLLRYDLWSERLVLLRLGPGGSSFRDELKDPGQLAEWFASHPLPIWQGAAPPGGQLRVTARLSPFSAAEERQTAAWLAQVFQVPAPPSADLPAGPSLDETEQLRSAPVFELLKTRQAATPLVELRWKYQLP